MRDDGDTVMAFSAASLSQAPLRSSPLARIATADPSVLPLIDRLVRLSLAGLRRAYVPVQRQFVFTQRKTSAGGLVAVGVSLRYSAISLLGILRADETTQRSILGGLAGREYAGLLLKQLPDATSLGDVALVTWAAAEARHVELAQAVGLLRARIVQSTCPTTVEAAWTLSALIAAHPHVGVTRDIATARARLLCARSDVSGVFAHYATSGRSPWYRAHLGSFADQVYPIQALARHAEAFADQESLTAAARTAEVICRCQGSAGQWWWHYDVRTGRVVEGYPVYTVHQDSMAPMALLDLYEAGGPDFSNAIRKSLAWTQRSPEIGRSLIDEREQIIWRKVGRTDPAKVTRYARAIAVRAHPRLRMEWLDRLFPPTRIDYESRPYHLGWILHTWLGRL